MAVEGGDVKEMIDFINEAGIGAIGTVEDARAQVQRLWDQSGGFGAMLLLGHEQVGLRLVARAGRRAEELCRAARTARTRLAARLLRRYPRHAKPDNSAIP